MRVKGHHKADPSSSLFVTKVAIKVENTISICQGMSKYLSLSLYIYFSVIMSLNKSPTYFTYQVIE